MKNKKNLPKLCASALPAILFLLSLCGQISSGNAQNITNVTNEDTLLATSIMATNTINCDIIQTMGSSSHLKAIAYDDPASGDVICKVFLTDALYRTITINGANNPDVVIADDASGTIGNDYIIVIVYDDGSDVYINNYSINVSGGSLGTVTAISSKQLNTGVNAGGQHVHTIRYDQPGMTPVGFINYVAVWHERGVSTGNMEVYYEKGNAASLVLIAGGYVDDGTYPDVACYRADQPTMPTPPMPPYNEEYAAITYIKPTTPPGTGVDLMVNYYEMITLSPNICALATNVTTTLPRIASKAHYDNNITDHPWTVASSVNVGGTFKVNLYDFNTTSCGSMANTPLAISDGLMNSYDHYKPAIAAGEGGEFGVLFYPSYDTSLYFSWSPQPDLNSWTPTDFNEVNYDNNGAINISPAEPVVAIDCWGGQEFLVSWWDGSNILWKEKRFGQFKPSSVKNVNASSISIYPNPAKASLYIKGAAKGSYSLADATGRIQLSGSIITDEQAVNIQHLPHGLYLMHIKTDAGAQTVKIVKE